MVATGTHPGRCRDAVVARQHRRPWAGNPSPALPHSPPRTRPSRGGAATAFPSAASDRCWRCRRRGWHTCPCATALRLIVNGHYCPIPTCALSHSWPKMQPDLGVNDHFLVRGDPVGHQRRVDVDVALDDGKGDRSEFVVARRGPDEADLLAVELDGTAVRRQVFDRSI